MEYWPIQWNCLNAMLESYYAQGYVWNCGSQDYMPPPRAVALQFDSINNYIAWTELGLDDYCERYPHRAVTLLGEYKGVQKYKIF